MAKEDIKNEAVQEQEVQTAEEVNGSKAKKEKAPKKPNEKEQLKQQLAEKEDQFLRLAAEYDNFRKRTQKEKEDLYQMSKVTVIGELLPVIDNFERAEQNKDVSLEEKASR